LYDHQGAGKNSNLKDGRHNRKKKKKRVTVHGGGVGVPTGNKQKVVPKELRAPIRKGVRGRDSQGLSCKQ